MSLTNVLKDRVQIQLRTSTRGPLGETVVWSPVAILNCRVIPLDAKAQAVYMQMKSEVSHKVIFRDGVSLSLGNNRLLWKDKTLELVEPMQVVGNATVVLVKEV